jgi:nucleoside-diphosphate-sugar epimerase
MRFDMRVLVTGAAGFIGFHVARYLLERGDTVVGVDNVNPYYATSDFTSSGSTWPTARA